MNPFHKPKLRPINVQRIVHHGEPVFLLQDSLRLTDAIIVLPQILGPLAMLCDGQHTIQEIKASLELRYGLALPQVIIENLLDQFNEALLLENETFHKVKQEALTEYRAAPFRKPALAGPSYPADAEGLRHMLLGYMERVNGMQPASSTSRGIISPHIDYQRGGSTYAQVWASAAEAVREADLVIIFGTDHHGGSGMLTLTPQDYASPLGVMPTDKGLVDKLAEILGPEAAFSEELHHRGEHSIELALIWLQYVRDQEPCSLLPVLTGSFQHYMAGEGKIEDDLKFKAFVDVLRDEMSRRRTVVVAAGDLAHLGPAFDGPPLDAAGQAQMKRDDELLLETLCQGDATAFFNFMKAGQYRRNICGLAPFYFTLEVLNKTRGKTIAYDRCPADNVGTSFVSVCGAVLD